MKMTIKSDCTDRELSEAVMLHVTKKTMSMVAFLPSYATSADAVLPLLEKWLYLDVYRDEENQRGPWAVAISATRESQLFVGNADTCARAACFALLKAHGVEVTES